MNTKDTAIEVGGCAPPVIVDTPTAQSTEWRWVDEKGRAMTHWKQGQPPPMSAVSDDKGTMRVEVREAAPTSQSGPSDRAIAFPVGGEPLPAIHRKRDGLLLIRTDGSCRYLGFRESLAYRLFRRIPNV